MSVPFGVGVATILLEKLHFHIFPVRKVLNAGTEEACCDCSDDGCMNAGKHPRIAWSKEPGVPSMWEKWPNDGFGIATGERSGIWVLDVDPKNGGFETLAALEQKHAPLPKTISVKTGSGGLHFYFKYPGPEYRNTAGALGPGLDTRGDGGYVVGPGSLHKNGKRYRWQVGPDTGTLAEAPEWLLTIVKQPERKKVDFTKRTEKQGLHTAGVPFVEAEFQLDHMMQSPLVVWMTEFPNDVPREVWRGLATNLACAGLDHSKLMDRACEAFHKISSEYDGYRQRETDNVFKDSIGVAATYGPMSFEHMLRHGMPVTCAVPTDAKNLAHAARMAWWAEVNRQRK